MKYFKISLFLFVTSLFLDSCFPDNTDIRIANDNFYKKTSAKFYSPDKRCFVTIVEHGLDSTVANTQVLITFDKTGAGIYTVKGIHKSLKVKWDDNSTITIETDKDNKSLQRLTQVQSFSDIIKINYINISTTQTLDSICTINEMLSDRRKHFDDLFNSLTKTDSSFTQIVSTFKHHITDTITKQKSKNIIILNFGNDFGIELHIKGIKKLKQIPFDTIKSDKMQMIQYYHGSHIIADDVIDDTTTKL